MMIPDKGIREMIWPSNNALPAVYVPGARLGEYGPITNLQVQPVSLDVRLSGEFIRHPDGQPFNTDPRYPYHLSAGECALGCLVERFRMNADNVVARVEGKSTIARQFLMVHAAGLIDPGFHGDITLEIKNIGHEKVTLWPGMLIAQVTFQFLSAPADRLYGQEGLGSHYQNQEGPTPPCD